MPQAKHRRGHSAIVNTSVLTPAIPQFQANVQEYDPVSQSDEEPTEKPVPSQARIDFEEALHDGNLCARCGARERLSQRRMPWIFGCAVLGALCLWLLLTRPSVPVTTTSGTVPGSEPAKGSQSELGSYETGFWNELAALKPQISLKTVQFSGSPQWQGNKGYVPTGEGKPTYVGKPSAGLDEAWSDLVKDRLFLLSDEEAEAAWGPDYKKWWVDDRGGYLAGIDMLHSLNCLNYLRQSLDPEYYPGLSKPGLEWHTDYCVEHLRQMIMCHGDVTPIPSRWVPSLHRYYIDTNRKHTCRDFEAIRNFATERVNGSIAVPPRDPKPHVG